MQYKAFLLFNFTFKYQSFLIIFNCADHFNNKFQMTKKNL